MQNIIITIIVLLSSHITYGQSNLLCNLEYENFINESQRNSEDSSIQRLNNEEIYQFVDSLMTKIGLPMNFQVRKCINCQKNASAWMSKNGTRHIRYNDDFFNQIKMESTKIGVLTVLAHEIGHHLSAHTLSLNQKNYKEALKFCKKSKNNNYYNKKICDSLFQKDYKSYKTKQREKELQADRFSGYIMNLYGAELQKIKNSWINLLDGKDRDDRNSTHPKLSRRLKAVEEGYSIAEKYKKSGKPINLSQFRNASVEFYVCQQEKTLIEMQKLVYYVWDSFDYISPSKIESNVPLRWDLIQTGQSIPDLGPKFNNIERNYYQGLTEENNEYFGLAQVGFRMNRRPEINFTADFGIHIEKGLLKILLFEDKSHRIIYQSLFHRDKISIQEIRSLVTEVVDNGLSNSIKDYEKNE